MSLISDSDREGARANVTQSNYALPLYQGGWIMQEDFGSHLDFSKGFKIWEVSEKTPLFQQKLWRILLLTAMLLESHSSLYCTTMNKKKKVWLLHHVWLNIPISCIRVPLRTCSNQSSKLVNISQVFPPWASVFSCLGAGLDWTSWEGHRLQGGPHVQVK